jgi:DNA polymerase I
MTEPISLAYLPDPFSVRKPMFCGIAPNGESHAFTAEQVSALEGPIATYDLSALIDELRRCSCRPPQYPIDIGEALRLLAGIPRDEGGERRWDVWRHLAPRFPSPAIARTFEAAAKCRAPWPNEPDLQSILHGAATAVQQLWLHVRDALASTSELERFLTVEVPVQAIFAHRQGVGIAVDRTSASELLVRLQDEKYAAYQKVAQVLGISPIGLTFWNVGPRLAKTDVAHLADISDGGRLRDAFKMAGFKSSFARDFLQFADASRDEVILRRAVGTDGRVYPVFAVLGTVSGRILVSDPYLQQLRRSYRSLIAADPGKRLIYLDYAQFEPGILAFLSEDERLIQAYNQGDLYTSLCLEVFGNEEMRPLAKRMFLAFCYGMDSSAIAKRVAPAGDQNAIVGLQTAVDKFFATFPDLAVYRRNNESALLRDGSIGSLLGNHRRRTSSGALSPKERRWSVNQPVQSTASLIFKEALIDIAKEFGSDSILLPVHDAVLMQFDDDEAFRTNANVATGIMINAFTRRCPGVNVRVTAGAFCD